MNLQLELHNDRDSLRSLDKGLKTIIQEKGLLTVGGKNVSFCGLVVSNDVIHAFLPRETNINIDKLDQKIQLASEMMAAIHRYSTTKNNEIYADDEGNDFFGLNKLSAIIWLLNDFRVNGLFYKRKQRRVVNSGKPDWKKTISNRTAFVTDSGPIYLDIDGTSSYRFVGEEITRIHADVIRKLDKEFSWLISTKKSQISASLKSINPPSGKVEFQLSHLKSQRHAHFATRDLELISHLIDFLEQIRGKDKQYFVMGLKHFHGMWENMLAETLNWTVKLNHLLAIPSYKLNDGTVVDVAKKGQRTDIVLRRPGTDSFAVADAKYYGVTKGTNNAPGWTDLVKQFFYAKALTTYRSSAQVTNAFIFPGKEGPILSAHMKNRQTGIFEDSEYTPIKCIYICPRLLIQHYIKGKKLASLSERLLSAGPSQGFN
ncbi:LlaJI family restriction endonuclease [Vibrio cholerae]|uniref:LlaJI family restriction endonuclease n=1 Tax=Vibrio cholerae TaxID=666 RepID=UPI0011F3F863|nr:LlaJI family restriction endonuclease [Vibrio cholerae]EKG0028411.1 LlaJI family restriction endonuclease [Vibrio cholerae]KAA0999898.1 LlaJI family restriction endonuclease [Vibrio cholerae]KAA1006793.1 LlaJI family restriction endonuclease [Vibrio cholerae]KAA1015431.1 LlaJI family restriction endonuclease [Vibrio cholerae]KAA1020424.1 LlaJI family restriction endonuclease [Vibrio cholerae]